MFTCPFGRYRHLRLPLRVASVCDMFQKNIDKLFSVMPNIFIIAEDILIASFDEKNKDHDETLDKVLRVCRQINLKLSKEKHLFRCTSIPFFDKVISQQGISPDPRKVQALTEMPPPKSRKNCRCSLVYYIT